MKKHYIVPQIETVSFRGLNALCGSGQDPWEGAHAPQRPVF
jgi:hypothetical protein